MATLTAAELNRTTSTIIGASIAIHRALGPGLYEEPYHVCLVHELRLANMSVETERFIAVHYKQLHIERAYKADIVVNDSVIVEIKSVDVVTPLHLRQLKTYLRLGDFRVGLLLNFGAMTMKEGIHRVVNDFPPA